MNKVNGIRILGGLVAVAVVIMVVWLVFRKKRREGYAPKRRSQMKPLRPLLKDNNEPVYWVENNTGVDVTLHPITSWLRPDPKCVSVVDIDASTGMNRMSYHDMLKFQGGSAGICASKKYTLTFKDSSGQIMIDGGNPQTDDYYTIKKDQNVLYIFYNRFGTIGSDIRLTDVHTIVISKARK